MILLDKNNKPQNTVYYLSGIVYALIQNNDGLDYTNIYSLLTKNENRKISIEFFSLALDFLYLLEKINLDKEWGLHAY